MPEAVFNGEKKWFRTYSQAAHYERTGVDPAVSQQALNEAVKETPPENVINESEYLGRLRVVKPE